jgi:hypothetical protein
VGNPHALRGEQLLQELVGSVGLAGADGHEDAEPQALKPADDVEQEPHGRRVGPLRVIQDEQDAAPLGQVRRQPVEPMEH